MSGRTAPAEPERGDSLFGALLDAAPDAIVVVGEDGRMRYVNAQAERLFGYARAELLGRGIEMLVPERFRRAHPARRGSYVAAPRVRPMGAELDLYALARDGRELPVEISLSPLQTEQGTLTSAAIRDVTNRVRSEERLREAEDRFRGAFESAAIGMALVAPDGRWLQVNRALCELIGYSERELLELGDFQAITHPEDLDADLALVRRTLAGEMQTYTMEKRYIHRLGHTIWARLCVSLVRDRNGRPVQFVSQIEDIGEQKRSAELAEQLRHAQKLDAVGRLAGAVAHDFNNMLTAISGYSQLLLDELGSDDPRRRLAEQISRAAENAAALPRQLLTFSRKEASQPEAIDVNSVLAATGDMLGRLVGADTHLTILPRAEAPEVLADPGSVEQVLVNLAMNAAEAMPEGGRLTISSRNADAAEAVSSAFTAREGPHVVIAVADEGEGMDAETRGRAFEPFFTTKRSGSGLGLATVYGIVRQSEGFINLESDPGRGTVVEIWLPCADEARAPCPGGSQEAPEGTAAAGTILVAEDEQLVRDLAVTVLEREGYEVLAADSGTEALAVFRGARERIDVVVTDMLMPGMNGGELAREVLALDPAANVLTMSGCSEEAPEPGAEGGAQPPILQKPFAPSALRAAVGDLLEQRPRRPRERERGGVTCLVADDHPAVLDAVSRYLEADGIEVVARAKTSEEAREEILTRRPTLGLLDVRMTPLTGLELSRELTVSAPETQIVLYTGYADRQLLDRALAAGARGFVSKDAPMSQLALALRAVAAGGTHVDPGFGESPHRAADGGAPPLTRRERQILAMVADGMTNEKTAEALGISAETVQTHVRNAMAKLGAETRTQAVATAFRRALLV